MLTAPSPEYLRWVEASGSLFANPAWNSVLGALGGAARFAWHPETAAGLQLACFRRGPFRVGVAGMPLAGEGWDEVDDVRFEALAQGLCLEAGLDLLRVNRSFRKRCPANATAARPEAWIDVLGAWDRSVRLRKDLAFARRKTNDIAILPALRDPGRCHELYVETVAAHGGRLRYNAAYFHALEHLGRSNPRVCGFSAVDAERGVIAFAVLGLDGRTAHYLHGAANEQARRLGITDLLIDAMVCRARDAGCLRLNFMATPWEQTGLARFKSKWSNSHGLSVTHDTAGSLAGQVAKRLLRWQSRDDRRRALGES